MIDSVVATKPRPTTKFFAVGINPAKNSSPDCIKLQSNPVDGTKTMAKLATKCGLLLFLATDHPLLAKRALERKKKSL